MAVQSPGFESFLRIYMPSRAFSVSKMMDRRLDYRSDRSSDEAQQENYLSLRESDHNDSLAFFKSIGAGEPDFVPMPKLMSLEEVEQQSRAFSACISQSFCALNSIMERHETMIQKRWRRKTLEQRRKILLSAWGGQMSKCHRPDFEAFRRETDAQRQSETRYREAFIWPYINQEDLTQPRNLLLFLHSRGRNMPSTFAATDLQAMHVGIMTRAVVPAFLNEHVLLCASGRGPETYGKLIHWHEHPDAINWLQTRREYQPGEGLLILEAQTRVMCFLLDCAKEILPDMTEHELYHGQLQPRPPDSVANETGLASLAIMKAESPYRVPHQLDFSRIESLLAAKYDEAADHLWSLREDPGYFSLTMRDRMEHRQEGLKDENGQAHPLFRKHPEDVLWGRVIGNEISMSYLHLEVMSELCDQCVKLKALQTCYQTEIRLHEDLPEEYLSAILTFHCWLEQSVKFQINSLSATLIASTPWRRYFQTVLPLDPTGRTFTTRTRPDIKMSKTQEHFMFLLEMLLDGDQLKSLACVTNIVDELHHLIETSKEASNMLTSYTASCVADLSIFTECLHQLTLYQPWAKTFEDTLVEREKHIVKDYQNRRRSWKLGFLALFENTSKILAINGAPSNVDFRYPVDKRRTSDNVAAMRQAEANLDKFWKIFDNLINRENFGWNGTATYSVLAERQLLRTPKWVEPNREVIDKGVVDAIPLNRPLTELYLDLEQRTQHTVKKENIPVSLRSKKKTRGASSSASEQVESLPNLEDDIDDSQPTFEVDARSFKVFKTLFFTPSLTATPGEVSWTDFLHAMVSIGFRAEKLYGSVWQFDPIKLDVRRSIQFHEPHPSGKIPYLTARRHGRRLNRAYGWHGDMFRLAGKMVV